jgi:predicted RND superfamily exporter protein
MMILFRSWFAGLLSAIPLILAIAMLFGLMGYVGIPLDIVSALLSSMMIGVGVDYTIHFLWRYREERANGLSYNDAVVKTITTTGRGILFNALSVIIGFSALFISSFIPVKIFAFLVVVSISGCLLGALVLVPVLCIWWKPEFLEPRGILSGGIHPQIESSKKRSILCN